MTAVPPEAIERKLASLRRFIADLDGYARLDDEGRRREHYAIERLLQLLCESAAYLGLQWPKTTGQALPGSYWEIFTALEDNGDMPRELAQDLIAACGMRNVLTHLYDAIDLDRVIAAVDPALALYREFLAWALVRMPKRN